jgi:hypothetical protein
MRTEAVKLRRRSFSSFVAKIAYRWLLCSELGRVLFIHSEHVFKSHSYEDHALSAVVFPVRVMTRTRVKAENR